MALLFAHSFTVFSLSMLRSFWSRDRVCLAHYHMPQMRVLPNVCEVLSKHLSSDCMNDQIHEWKRPLHLPLSLTMVLIKEFCLKWCFMFESKNPILFHNWSAMKQGNNASKTLNVMNIPWNKFLFLKKKNSFLCCAWIILPTGISAWDYLHPQIPSLKSIFKQFFMSPVNQGLIRAKTANEYSLLKSEKANAWNKKKELGRTFLRVHFSSLDWLSR